MSTTISSQNGYETINLLCVNSDNVEIVGRNQLEPKKVKYTACNLCTRQAGDANYFVEVIFVISFDY